MWPKNWVSITENTSDFVEKVRGRSVQPWDYTVSHSQLLVRYRDEGVHSGIYLLCKACESVRFETSWQNANPDISIVEQDEVDQLLEIVDGANFKVICGYAFWVYSAESISLTDAFSLSAD